MAKRWSPILGVTGFDGGSKPAISLATRTGRLIGGEEVQIDRGPGACCYDDGTCDDLFEFDCISSGGTWQGPGTDCDPNPCPQSGGACCCGDGPEFFGSPFSCSDVENEDACAEFCVSSPYGYNFHPGESCHPYCGGATHITDGAFCPCTGACYTFPENGDNGCFPLNFSLCEAFFGDISHLYVAGDVCGSDTKPGFTCSPDDPVGGQCCYGCIFETGISCNDCVAGGGYYVRNYVQADCCGETEEGFPDQYCCGSTHEQNTCCYVTESCCGDGLGCCPSGCGCRDPFVSNGDCCPEGETCCITDLFDTGHCCASDQTCCYDSCCPLGTECCGPGGECCEEGETCCDNTICCPDDQECVDGTCV